MNHLLLTVPKSPSLVSLAAFRDIDATCGTKNSTLDGQLLEYHHLELRVHPPNVEFTNTREGTTITIDSANRPGTLVEVVQWLTEMGLNVRKARISSDGGWFVDEFHTDRISDKLKENEIRRVLGAETPAEPSPSIITEETVFELAGPDRAGLLAEVVALLKSNGCDVQSAAVWTSHGRAAFVVSVLEQQPPGAGAGAGAAGAAAVAGVVAAGRAAGQSAGGAHSAPAAAGGGSSGGVAAARASGAGAGPGAGTQQRVGGGHAIRDPVKLERLKELLERMMLGANDTPTPYRSSPPPPEDALVQCSTVKGGLIHFERRLHRLLLLREEADWWESDLVAHYEALVGNGQGELPAWGRAPPPSPHGAASSTNSTDANNQLDRAASTNSILGWQYEHLPATPGAQVHGGTYLPHRLSISSSPGLPPTAPGSTASHLQLPPLPVTSPGNGSVMGLPPTPTSAWSAMLISPKHSKPEVSIRHNSRLKYWLVEIRCKDRKKLFFDTVCTLADLHYDIFHASVDVEGDLAHQVYYIRRCTGDSTWSPSQAAKLCYMLEASIQRRFPRGIKIRIQSWQQYDLAALTAAWRDAGLLITRAKVRPCTGHSARGVSNTFYLLDQKTGAAPDQAVVQRACVMQGGVSMVGGDHSHGVSPSANGTNGNTTPGYSPPGPTNGATASTISQAGALHAAGVAGIAAVLKGGSAAGNGTIGAGVGGVVRAGTGAGAGMAVSAAMDVIRERCQGAAFGFALMHRTHVGSPSSMASSM